MSRFRASYKVADQLVSRRRGVSRVDGETWRKKAPSELSCWACDECVFEGFWLLFASRAGLDLLTRPVSVGGKVRLS